jgi:hypothetical protein
MYIRTENKTKTVRNRFVNGEIIAVEKAGMYILTQGKEDSLRYVEKLALKHARISIALMVDDPERIKRRSYLMGLIHFIHGWWNIFTFPLTGAPRQAIVGGAIKKGYFIKYPEAINWEELSKFARFPQGMPPNMDLKDIQRK